MLTVKQLTAFYGDFQALFGIDFTLEHGECVAIIGANGAGKSTLLKTICGQIRVPADAIAFEGRPIGSTSTDRITEMGIAMVPEGRRLFASLTVEENLLSGRFSKRTGKWNLDTVYQLFPDLLERRHHLATQLSGGQQQMVAIGRALMSNPKLLICDEISLGLAPIVVKGIYAALPGIMADGLSVILVEQDVDMAQRMSNRLYCLMHGKVALEGVSEQLTRQQISAAYFGV